MRTIDLRKNIPEEGDVRYQFAEDSYVRTSPNGDYVVIESNYVKNSDIDALISALRHIKKHAPRQF